MFYCPPNSIFYLSQAKKKIALTGSCRCHGLAGKNIEETQTDEWACTVCLNIEQHTDKTQPLHISYPQDGESPAVLVALWAAMSRTDSVWEHKSHRPKKKMDVSISSHYTKNEAKTSPDMSTGCHLGPVGTRRWHWKHQSCAGFSCQSWGFTWQALEQVSEIPQTAETAFLLRMLTLIWLRF